MSEKYIRRNKNSFAIIKNSKNYGKFTSIEDAKLIRDELVKNNWDLSSIEEIYNVNGQYLIFKVIDDKIHLLERFTEKPAPDIIERIYKKHLRNPNNSRYGLNITRLFDTFIIKKQIAGDEYIFGYYDNIEDAEFVRNFLMDHDWNVNGFAQIEYDDEKDNYKVVEVIEDKAYVLATFEDEIDLDKVHAEFLAKITKHKLGLAMHPYLDELKYKIPELEERFNTKAHDDVWSFKNTQNPLEDIIFTLTPFQKSVYDVIDDVTFDEIKRKLIRFKSGNFDEKIRKNLNELEKLGLISENENHYIKKSR